MKGFKNFIMRGSLIDTAVAFIIGAAFGAVVTSFTQIVLDLPGKPGGTPNFSRWSPRGVHVGTVLPALSASLVLAAVVDLAIVVPSNDVRELRHPDAEKTQTEAEILTEIRDLLARNEAQGIERVNDLAASNSPSLEGRTQARRSSDG